MLSPQLFEKAHNALTNPDVSDEVKSKIHDLIQSPDDETESTLDNVILGE